MAITYLAPASRRRRAYRFASIRYDAARMHYARASYYYQLSPSFRYRLTAMFVLRSVILSQRLFSALSDGIADTADIGGSRYASPLTQCGSLDDVALSRSGHQLRRGDDVPEAWPLPRHSHAPKF